MVYFGLFESRECVEREFATKFEGKVIYAHYCYEDYDGSALVIFERDGKLYMVEGGHCSCHGLEEGQWCEEELTRETAFHLAGIERSPDRPFSSWRGFWNEPACQEAVRRFYD